MYVFGIDMPIMELLFAIMAFMTIGLIAIIWEIRKLRKLIMTEQADIYRFEADLSELNPSEIKKHAKTLEEFIQAYLRHGYKKADIEHILEQRGWPREMVEEAFKKSIAENANMSESNRQFCLAF